MATARKYPHKDPPRTRRETSVKKLEHQLHEFHERLERLTMTAADLQAAVDSLKTAVAKVQDELTALKSKPELITQAQLDANATDVAAAASTLQAL